jgi:hypothetical protein
MRLKAAAVAVVGALLALAGVYIAGRKDGRQKAAQDAAEDYIQTRKRMDNAEKPTDPEAARAWLRERQSKRM